jgi:uncharacterized SAM-binding protein YcdF (DUF218 family)
MKRSRAAVKVVFVALAWVVLAWIAARALIVRKALDRVDSIVILAGSSTYEERARHAAQMLNSGRASRIILTNDHGRGGWSEQKQTNPLFVESASEELQSLGVPRERVDIISTSTQGTYYEALLLRDFAQSHKVKSLLIVTSAYHSRRALWTFKRVFEGTGVEIGMDAAEPGEQTPSPGTWWFHLVGWQMVPMEYVKLVYYRIHY